MKTELNSDELLEAVNYAEILKELYSKGFICAQNDSRNGALVRLLKVFKVESVEMVTEEGNE